LHPEVLILALHKREVGLDSVEVGRVGYVEYRVNFKLLKFLFYSPRFVDTQIIKKKTEFGARHVIFELLKKVNK
jgi:hypothetical protein